MGVGMKRHGVTFWCIVLLLLGVNGAFGQLQSQTRSSQPMGESAFVLPKGAMEKIYLGPVIFKPGFDLSWESRDNIFFSPEKVSDQLWVGRVHLNFDLPIHESHIRFSYSPVYRNYRTYALPNKWSHFVDLGGDFVFSNGLKIDALYRFVSGNMDTREVDPGGELVFGDQQFDKSYFSLRADYWISATNGISFQGSYDTISYDERDRYSFYDYDRTRLGGGWIHQMSPTLVGGLIYNHEEFEPKETYGYRQSSSDEIVFTFNGKITPVWSAAIQVGWRNTSYEKVADLIELSDTSGLLVRGNLQWDLAHSSSLLLDLVRQDFPSAYQFQTHYIGMGANLTYRIQLQRLFAHARFGYQNNDYGFADEITGEDRSDDITTFGLGVGYRLSTLFSLRGTYTYQKRDSISNYSYDANVFLIGLTVGF